MHTENVKTTNRRTESRISDEAARAIRTNPPRILNTAEAAAFLTISPRTLGDLVRRGRIPSATIGRKRRVFRLEDLEATIGRLAGA